MGGGGGANRENMVCIKIIFLFPALRSMSENGIFPVTHQQNEHA